MKEIEVVQLLKMGKELCKMGFWEAHMAPSREQLLLPIKADFPGLLNSFQKTTYAAF
jgi:hypothetical protein